MRMPAQLLPRITISYCSEWEHHTYTVSFVTRRMRVRRVADVYQQPTATCCNTLHQTACLLLIIPTVATHCNTLQHTATHCNTLQHTATHCMTTLVQTHCCSTHCNILQHSTKHCNTLQKPPAHLSTAISW